YSRCRSLSSLFMFPPPPRSPLFPYTTLFRSQFCCCSHYRAACGGVWVAIGVDHYIVRPYGFFAAFALLVDVDSQLHSQPQRIARSEEHTSELQSRENLVCRLLLEKTNNMFY